MGGNVLYGTISIYGRIGLKAKVDEGMNIMLHQNDNYISLTVIIFPVVK